MPVSSNCCSSTVKYRHARRCNDNEYVDVWMLSTDAATFTGAFSGVFGNYFQYDCLYFDFEGDSLQSTLGGTLFAAASFTSKESCETCCNTTEVCADPDDPGQGGSPGTVGVTVPNILSWGSNIVPSYCDTGAGDTDLGPSFVIDNEDTSSACNFAGPDVENPVGGAHYPCLYGGRLLPLEDRDGLPSHSRATAIQFFSIVNDGSGFAHFDNGVFQRRYGANYDTTCGGLHVLFISITPYLRMDSSTDYYDIYFVRPYLYSDPTIIGDYEFIGINKRNVPFSGPPTVTALSGITVDGPAVLA